MNKLYAVPAPALLAVLIVLYLVLGGLYVWATPTWQAPDEPAHYNYLAHIAATGQLPVLQQGDYPAAYLEQIKAAGFPADMPTDSIRYESWQPPLYYLLGTPVFLLTKGLPLATQVKALRLFSLLIGALLIPLTYRLASEALPGRKALALGATAFLLAVPMHVAMLSSINNDGLAEVLLTAVMLVTVLAITRAPSNRRLVALGALVGLCLLTKNTAALSVPIAGIGVLVATRRAVRRPTTQLLARNLALVLAPALLISVGWYIRNALVYGVSDVLIWQRHSQVVAGQLTTAEYLAGADWMKWLGDFLGTTLHSFWGQFGWMAVPMNTRVYLILGSITALAILGLGFLAARLRRARLSGTFDESALIGEDLWVATPLLLGLLLTAALYLWYNREFVQFQGRYLFPAMAPLGIAFVAGLSEAIRQERAKLVSILFGLGAWMWIGIGLDQGSIDKLGLALLVAAFAGFTAKRWLPTRYDAWIVAAVLVALIGLTAVAPFVYVARYLSGS